MISSLLKTSNNTTVYRPHLDTWASGHGASKCKKDPPKGVSAGIKTFVDVGDVIHKKRNLIDIKINENILKYNRGVDYMKYEQTLNDKTAIPSSNVSSIESKSSISPSMFKELLNIDQKKDIHLLSKKKSYGKIVVNAQVHKNDRSSTDNNLRNTTRHLKHKPTIARNAIKTELKDTIRHTNVLFSLANGVNTNMHTRHTSSIDKNDNYKNVDTHNYVINKLKTEANASKTAEIDINDYRSNNTDSHIKDRVNIDAKANQSHSLDKTDYTHNNIELSERPDASSEATCTYNDNSKTSYSNSEKISAKQVDKPVYENFETSKLPQHYKHENNNAQHYTSGKLNTLDLSSFSMSADSVRPKN